MNRFFNKPTLKDDLKSARNLDEKKLIALKYAKSLQKTINSSLSDESAQGNVDVVINFSSKDNLWFASVSGSLCSGYDNNGVALWRDVDDVLNTTEWSSNDLFTLICNIHDTISSAKPINDAV